MLAHRIIRIALVALIVTALVVLEPWIKFMMVLIVSLITGLALVTLLIVHLKVQPLTFNAIATFVRDLLTLITRDLEARIQGIRSRYRHVSVHDYFGMLRDIRIHIVDQIDVLVSKDEGSMKSFIHEADDEMLGMVATRLLDAADPVRIVEFRDGERRGELSVHMLRQAVEQIGGDPDARHAVEVFVVTDLLHSRSSRRDMYLTFLNLREWEQAMMREMDSLATELQIQAPAVYQDWDRHVNEGEFRVSCSVPLGVASVVVATWSSVVNGFHWSIFGAGGGSLGERWAALGEVLVGAPLNFVLAALGFTAALVIHRSGVASQRQADSLMMRSCLARGVVKSAATPTSMNLASLGWRSRRMTMILDDPHPRIEAS